MSDAKDLEVTPVSRDRWVRIATYAGVLFAYLAAVENDRFTPVQLCLFAGAVLWSLLLEHKYKKIFFSAPVKVVLIGLGACIFLYFVARHARGAEDGVSNSISRFLFWNAIVFMLSRNKTEYDLWTIAIIDLSLFMISGAFVQPARFLPLFVACLLTNLYVFGRLALLRCGPAGEKEKRGVGLSMFQFALVVEIAAVVFFFFPRGLFRVTPPKGPGPRADQAQAKPEGNKPKEGDPVKDGADRTGIPDRLDQLPLTNYAKLKIDRRVALELRVVDASTARLEQMQYLRGAILDTYENGEWKARFETGDFRVTNPTSGRPMVHQRIWLEPTAGELLFAFAEPVEVSIPATYDRAGILFRPVAKELTVYDVRSRVPGPGPEDVRIAQGDPRYLQLPPRIDGIRAIADRRAGRLRTIRQKVDALVGFFKEEKFAYRLGAFVSVDGLDPAEFFVTRKREGYCVHFATALALMLRAQKVPCRIATGFHVSEYDAEKGRFVVRNSDAHAWVEVWYGPQAGWVAADPTPEESDAPLPEGTPVATNEKKEPPKPEVPKSEEPKRDWDAFVRDFGSNDQGSVIEDAAASVGRFLQGVGRFFTRPAVWAGALALAVGAILFWLFLPGRHRRRLRQLLGGFRESTTVDFYRDFLWILSKRGVRKAAGQTGWEFARQARLLCNDDGIDLVTDKFYAVRYAGRALTDEERREVDAALVRLSARAVS